MKYSLIIDITFQENSIMRINNGLITALFLISPSLYAHTGGHIDHSLMSGLLHPLTGIDHMLVLIAVGYIAAKQGGKALFVSPIFFIALMATGALLYSYAIQIPFIETFIAFSLLAFGLLVSFNRTQQSKILFLGISFFAVFHGYAHAAEIPTNSSSMSYLFALIMMSLVICLSGGILGLIAGKRINYLFSLICLSSGMFYLMAGQ
jgi:urease accessory protein